MSRGREAILARRAALVARAAEQRDDMALQLGAWEGVLAGADRVLGWLGALRRNVPLVGIGMSVVAAAFTLTRGRAVATWLNAATVAWRLGRSAWGLFSRLRA